MSRRRNSRGRPVSGVLLLDKPVGFSSNAILQKVKRLYSANKAGHTGSLDPLASGVLPICLGEATKFSSFLLDADKCYQTICKLGQKTDTGDAEGEIVAEQSVPELSDSLILDVLQKFTGNIQQIPPMYSALKRDGQPLYKLARQGKEVERDARPVTIYDLELLSWSSHSLSLSVRCSKGTYIRTLVEDIGEMLGCGAHITMLRRVAAGEFGESGSYTFDELQENLTAGGEARLDSLLLPVDCMLTSWPEVNLAEDAAYYLLQGQPVRAAGVAAGWVRIRDSRQAFLGIGELQSDGMLVPRRLIAQNPQNS